MLKKVFTYVVVFLCTIINIACSQSTEEILAKVNEATGGKEKQKSIKSMISISRSSVVNPPVKDFPTTMIKTIVERPNKIFRAVTTEKHTTIASYDGKAGWITMGNQAIPLPPEQSLELSRMADIDGYFGAFIDPKSKGYNIENIGVVEMDGITCYHLKIGGNNTEQEFFISCKDYLPVKRISRTKTTGIEMLLEEFYREYMNVDGIKFPKVIEVKVKSAGDTKFSLPTQPEKLVYESIKLNQKISQEMFTIPK